MHGIFGGMGFGWFFWVIIIVFAVLAMTRFTGKGSLCNTQSAETPLDILKKRYAKGEISGQEYEELKNNLKN